MSVCVLAAWRWRCLGKDFPRAVAHTSMCSHRGHVHMLTNRKHMVSFQRVVPACGPGITETVRWICRGHKHTKTQPENNPTTFYLCLRSRNLWAPRRPCCTWNHAYRKHFLHACVHWTCNLLQISDYLNDLKLLISHPLGEQGGLKKWLRDTKKE